MADAKKEADAKKAAEKRAVEKRAKEGNSGRLLSLPKSKGSERLW